MSHPETASFAEFARLSGFKQSYVTQLKHDGRLVLTDDRKPLVKVAESLALIERTRDPSKVGVTARHAAEREGGDLDVPRGTFPAQPPSEEQEGGMAEGAAVAGANPKYQDARARRETAMAAQAERDLAISMGELLKRAEIRAAVSAAAVTLRARLEPLGQILAPQLVGLDQEKIASTIDAEVHHALNELARQFSAIAKDQAA